MYGAILGDIVGSPFEFDKGNKTKDFELFTQGCNFTDDSVMTVAVAEALIAVGSEATENDIKEAVISNMQDWGRRYPNAGYGGSFRHWLKEKDPKPYGSYGNGSAMRVSAAGWLYSTLERTEEVARFTAEVTHNHKEGIKGAEATAACIFLARSGATKETIKKYVEEAYGYDLNRTLNEIRPYYHHVESCQETVPEAIISFLESENYEDAIRNAISLGGDTDTLAAITGGIAEAFYGMSAILKAECRSRVAEDMLDVICLFDKCIGRVKTDSDHNKELSGNTQIETAIEQLYEQKNKNSFIMFATTLCSIMSMNGHALVPFVPSSNDILCDLDVYQLKEGATVTLSHDVYMHMDTVTSGENQDEWFYLFTNEEEVRKQQCGNITISIPIYDMFEITYKTDKVKGLVINPFGLYIRLDKQLLSVLLEEFRINWREE